MVEKRYTKRDLPLRTPRARHKKVLCKLHFNFSCMFNKDISIYFDVDNGACLAVEYSWNQYILLT